MELTSIIKSLGYLGVWAIVFAESGLLIGFFLPGDSLLFTAGFLASLPQTDLDIRILSFGCFVFAVLGDNVGYATGYRLGRNLFNKENSWLFNKKNLVAAQNFYETHGSKAIVLARFLPVVRTFAPIVAGIGAMKYKTFMLFNLIGGFVWSMGLTLLGYYLGKIIPSDKIDKYLIPIIMAIIIISIVPSVLHILKEKKSRKSDKSDSNDQVL